MPVNGINDWLDVLIVFLVALLGLMLWLLGTAMVIWFERRLIARMQYRVGPIQVGPWGIFQSFIDGLKFFIKEDMIPEKVDRVVYVIAPLISAVVGMSFMAIIPFGGTMEWFGREVRLQIWDPEVGMLWALAWSSIGVYGIILAGWASNSKYALMGGVRASAQMIAYELAFGLSVCAVFLWNGSMKMSDIVTAQSASLFPGVPVLEWIPAWNVIPMFPAFVLFFTAGLAETGRPPFDLPEAEGELVAGFMTEYTAARFAMFYLAEFMNMITMAAFTVTLFFGGTSGPLTGIGVIDLFLPGIWFFIKILCFLYIFVAFRGSMPRFRYPHLMDLGWKVMLPAGIFWVGATGLIVAMRAGVISGGPGVLDVLPWIGGVIVLVAVAYVVGPFLNDAPPPSEPDDDDETLAVPSAMTGV